VAREKPQKPRVAASNPWPTGMAIQPYFESGFPHGRDRCLPGGYWAALALMPAGGGSAAKAAPNGAERPLRLS
jgi:hypothetical protein